MLKQLKQWIDLGYKMFPVHPNQKKPIISAWEKEASCDPEVLARWCKSFPGCNWAIAPGPSGLVVLDVDPRNGGEDSFSTLDIEVGIPTTFEVTTPSGGKHLYMKGETRSRNGLRPGLDIKSLGGYVLIPPSSIDGKPYVSGGGEVAEVPCELVSMVSHKAEGKLADPVMALDLPSDVERAKAYLSSRPGAIEGQSGDTFTFATAAQIRDWGISEELNFELMRDFWNDKCSPPWDMDGLRLKVHNAYKHSSNSLGCDSISNAPFKEEKVFVDHGDDFVPCTELWGDNPEREWVAEGWLPKGPSCPTLFAGDGGTGKSLAAMQLCVAVATGTDWFGIRTTQMPTLYVGCEDDEAEMSRRLSAIRASNPDWAGKVEIPCYVMSRTGKEGVLVTEGAGNTLVKSKFFTQLDTAVMKMPKGPKLLVLDTVADVFAGNENSRAAVNNFIKTEIGGFAKKYDLTVVLIAHPSKGKGSEFSGSSAWSNAVRNRLFLRPQDTDNPTFKVLENAKANYAPTGKEIILKWDSGILVVVADDDAAVIWDSAVYEVIKTQWEKGSPLIKAHQGGERFVGKAKIFVNNSKKRLSKESILRAVANLIAAGKVDNITDKSEGNGLKPTGKVEADAENEDAEY